MRPQAEERELVVLATPTGLGSSMTKKKGKISS